jgi:hypothetical protein
MQNVEIGPLSLSLQRTVRVRDNNEASNLPPSLGTFEVYKVSDFAESCPKSWDKDGFFIAMHSQEAMWMSFQNCEPVAIMVGIGSINAVNGNKFDIKLEKDGYLVAPPQPWLDGWKGDDGTVYQFIATEVGENKTIGEQLTETKDHAILVSVFRAKNPEKLKSFRVGQTWGDSEAGECGYEAFAGCCKMAVCSFGTEMGLGKGGKIKQKIYEDPHGIEEWKERPEKTVKIYLINASEFAEITGQVLPVPVSAEQYNGIWFDLKDEELKDVSGSSVFNNLKSAI